MQTMQDPMADALTIVGTSSPTAMPFAGSVVVPTRARGQWTKATRKVTIIGAFNHIRSTFGSWRVSDPLNRGDEFVVPPADHEDDMALDAMDALTNDITRGFLPTMHHAEEKVEVMGMADTQLDLTRRAIARAAAPSLWLWQKP